MQIILESNDITTLDRITREIHNKIKNEFLDSSIRLHRKRNSTYKRSIISKSSLDELKSLHSIEVPEHIKVNIVL